MLYWNGLGGSGHGQIKVLAFAWKGMRKTMKDFSQDRLCPSHDFENEYILTKDIYSLNTRSRIRRSQFQT
jgi:hypothetical protein